MEQDRISSRAFHQGPDRRTAYPEDQIAFPVAWYRAIQHRWGPLTNQDLRCNEGFTASTGARPRDTQCAAGAQACSQLTAQRTAPLHIQRLVDRLVTDAHGSVFGKVEWKT